MTEDEYLFSSRPAEIRFLGSFEGNKLGQFELRAFSSGKLNTRGLNVITYFSGWIEDELDGKITVVSTCQLTVVGKFGLLFTFLLVLGVLTTFLVSFFAVNRGSLLPLIAVLLMLLIFSTVLYSNIRDHIRFFEKWFLEEKSNF